MAKSAKKAAFLKKVIGKSMKGALAKKKIKDGAEESSAHEKTETDKEEMGEPSAPMSKKFGNLMKAVKK